MIRDRIQSYMEESNQNINKPKSSEINSLVCATNISVVIILCLCVAAYLIVEKNISISNSVCTNIVNNSKLLSWSFVGFIFFPQFLTTITLNKHELTETIWWKVYEFIRFILSTLYLPIYLFYSIVCSVR